MGGGLEGLLPFLRAGVRMEISGFPRMAGRGRWLFPT